MSFICTVDAFVTSKNENWPRLIVAHRPFRTRLSSTVVELPTLPYRRSIGRMPDDRKC